MKVAAHERVLTAGEIEMAWTVFKDGIDYDKVRVHKGSYFWFNLQSRHTAVTPNGKMYFLDDLYVDDFSATNGPHIWKRSFFMHEMTHVWQYQRGYAVRWHALTVTIRGQRAYRYTIAPGAAFHDYNMEQQGNLVADYYAVQVLKAPFAVFHRGYVGTPDELDRVLAPLLEDPGNADNLPR